MSLWINFIDHPNEFAPKTIECQLNSQLQRGFKLSSLQKKLPVKRRLAIYDLQCESSSNSNACKNISSKEYVATSVGIPQLIGNFQIRASIITNSAVQTRAHLC